MSKSLAPSQPVSRHKDRSSARLSPTLFDRLVEPGLADAVESRQALDRTGREQAMPLPLRECVLRDMARLLNATRLLDASQARAYPQVARSVVNYGVLPLAGAMVSSLDVGQVEEAIRQALMHYEPRLLPESIDVRLMGDDAREGHPNVLTFEISAKLWDEPRPVPLLVYTDLDLESGAASVRALAER